MRLPERVKECKKYSGNIMNDVKDILNTNGYQYIVDTHDTELAILNKPLGKDQVEELISESLAIPKVVTSMLLQFKNVKDRVIIRVQMK